MIPPIPALAAWAAVGFALTAVWPGYRAFTWTFLGATFFMPSAIPDSHQIVGLPDLDRVSVIAVGMFPATLLFHTTRMMRFERYDLLLIPLALLGGYSSVVNGFGNHDALSNTASVLLRTAIPLYLVRVYITKPEHARYFLKTLLRLSAVYALLLLFEWRTSPQAHRVVYGYFPHFFYQMIRGGHFRPMGFFNHALDVAYLYAAIVVIGYALWKAREPGITPRLLVLPVLALLASMSMGPILYAALGIAIVRFKAGARVGMIMTIAPFLLVFLALSVTENQENLAFLVDYSRAVSEERADSLAYRLNAFEYYIQGILQRPLFGHGGWGHGMTRIAIDSALLLKLQYHGFAFVGVYYLWVFCALCQLRRLANALRNTGTAVVLLGLYAVLAVAVVYDFIVVGTTLPILVICSVYNGVLKPEGEDQASSPLENGSND